MVLIDYSIRPSERESHLSEIFEVYRQLQQEQKFCDVLFFCNDSIVIGAHKCILNKVSPHVLAPFFTTDDRETVHIILPDVSSVELSTLCELLYVGSSTIQGTVAIEFSNVINLLGIVFPAEAFGRAATDEDTPRSSSPPQQGKESPSPNQDIDQPLLSQGLEEPTSDRSFNEPLTIQEAAEKPSALNEPTFLNPLTSKADLWSMTKTGATNGTKKSLELMRPQDLEIKREMDPEVALELVKKATCYFCDKQCDSVGSLKYHLSGVHFSKVLLNMYPPSATNAEGFLGECCLCKTWVNVRSSMPGHLGKKHDKILDLLPFEIGDFLQEKLSIDSEQIGENDEDFENDSDSNDTESLRCYICKKPCFDIGSLRIHLMDDHFQDTILESHELHGKTDCPLCPFKVSSMPDLARHIGLQHMQLLHILPRSVSQVLWRDDNNNTVKNEKAGTPRSGDTLACPVCHTMLNTPSRLREHMVSHFRAEIKRHFRLADADSVCPICEAELNRPSAVHRHIATVHHAFDEMDGVPDEVRAVVAKRRPLAVEGPGVLVPYAGAMVPYIPSRPKPMVQRSSVKQQSSNDTKTDSKSSNVPVKRCVPCHSIFQTSFEFLAHLAVVHYNSLLLKQFRPIWLSTQGKLQCPLCQTWTSSNNREGVDSYCIHVGIQHKKLLEFNVAGFFKRASPNGQKPEESAPKKFKWITSQNASSKEKDSPAGDQELQTNGNEEKPDQEDQPENPSIS